MAKSYKGKYDNYFDIDKIAHTATCKINIPVRNNNLSSISMEFEIEGPM